MSEILKEDIERWTAFYKSVLVVEIIKGKTTVVGVSRHFDLILLRIENWS